MAKVLKEVTHGYLGKDIYVERDPDLDEEHEVLCQEWTESEAGWGQRPDGYSLHIDMRTLKAYVEAYWGRMPAKPPHEYSYPDGNPYHCLVDGTLYVELKEKGGSIRDFSRKLPKKI